jgi:superfamily II DNA or RNA helicase
MIEQLLHLGFTIENAEPVAGNIGRTRGWWVTSEIGERFFVTKNKFVLPDPSTLVLLTKDGQCPTSAESAVQNRARWMNPASTTALGVQAETARESWRQRVQLVEAEEGRDFSGLRSPQVGAIYATLAHWKTTEEPATIVMPTGTGKTETMLALLVHQRCPRLLVVVPTDALRAQIADKFVGLGWLHRLGVLAPGAHYPVVARLLGALKTVEQADAAFAGCNVLVTTMNVLHYCQEPALQRLAELCSHLFIDEAHHISAPTWTKVRQVFMARRIVQFTATPFRNDKKYVDGKIIFNYPLSKAQREEYFKPINLLAVNESNPLIADQLIAARAVRQLEADEQNRYRHLIMARTKSIPRAEQVLEYYKHYPELRPVLMHSKLEEAEKSALLAELRAGRSRVVVCVNMLGEGFDLPELKIAAIHDAHKSLAITLQFTGRFTRFRRDLGDANMVVNIADVEVRDELRELYAEDANWNYLLRRLSEGATGEQEELSEFFQGFEPLPLLYSLQNITPKMSTVVFETPADGWQPEQLAAFFGEERLLDRPSLNAAENVAVVVVRQTVEVDWAAVRDLRNLAWDLYLLYWDEDNRLLYINSSTAKSTHDELAAAVFAEPVVRKAGEQIFRVLDGITRLSLTNLGLSHVIGRAVRFTMFMGTDTLQGLSEASRQNKTKSNTFGFGYRDGGAVTAGGSLKGKIWSYKIASTIPEWTKWCRAIGGKLLDNTIDIDQIFEHIIKYEPLSARPAAVPLAMAWSEEVMSRPESTIQFTINGVQYYLYQVGLRITTLDDTSPICFEVFSDAQVAAYEIQFGAGTMTYVALRGTVAVSSSRTTWSLAEWLAKEPPVLYFHDRSIIQHNLLARITQNAPPYPASQLEPWDWAGIDIKKESQGPQRSQNTVQFRVIAELKKAGYCLLFDDDDSGEAADVVAVRETAGGLHVDLFHCKYSGEPTPGARVGDLYEVCGQAQKSIHWYIDPWRLFKHLQHRESLRAGSTTRFEIGDLALVQLLERRARQQRVTFGIVIVQPGLSQRRISVDQLRLLAGAAAYLKETYELPFRVIASA